MQAYSRFVLAIGQDHMPTLVQMVDMRELVQHLHKQDKHKNKNNIWFMDSHNLCPISYPI